MVGIPSIAGQTIEDLSLLEHDHDNEWYEVWANNLSADYFDSKGMFGVRSKMVSEHYLFDYTPDTFFDLTIWSYMAILLLL